MANGEVSGAAVASGSMYNNTMRDNLIGWTCWQTSCAQEGYLKDLILPCRARRLFDQFCHSSPESPWTWRTTNIMSGLTKWPLPVLR